MLNIRTLSFTAILGLVSAASAVRPAIADDPPGSPVLSDPVFQALRTDGTTASGRIRQLGPDGRVVLVAGEVETVIPLDRLVKLTREGDIPDSPPEGSVALFPDGDRLRAIFGASGDKTLEITPHILDDTAIPVPIDGLLGMVLAPPTEPQAFESLLARVRNEPRKSEVLWLANGDRMTGGFLGLTAQKVAFQRDAGATEVDRSGIVAIGFDPAVVNYPAAPAPSLELTFLDGSRLGVTGCRIEQGHVVATTRFGVTIRPALAKLARVHVRGETIAYLSDRKETQAEYVGYLGTHRKTYGRNTTMDGRVLRMGGQPYDRGLGTQSRTLLAYRLDPRDRRFQATVGLDDRAGPLGSVIFRVNVDGKDRFVSPPMTVRDTPRLIDVDLTGARFLILATEFGERGDVQDLADWIEARIIRSSP
ncbi:MAG: putative carbohydrate binding protein [Planctomycetota bacterium]|nr:putative carbohydrate binding protein [Planctomycetota bacterium]